MTPPRPTDHPDERFPGHGFEPLPGGAWAAVSADGVRTGVVSAAEATKWPEWLGRVTREAREIGRWE